MAEKGVEEQVLAMERLPYYTKKPPYISVQRSSLYTFKTAH